MANAYLIDSNVIIDYTGNEFPESTAQKLDSIFNIGFDYSIISRMEVLVFDKTPSYKIQQLISFLNIGQQYDVEISVCNKVIEIRPLINIKLKLPDLVIAATALVNNQTLMTRNTKDFKHVPGLKLENPWDWD